MAAIDFEDLGPPPPGWADPGDDPRALPQPILPRRPDATLLKKVPGKAKTTTLPEDQHYKVGGLPTSCRDEPQIWLTRMLC